MATAATENNPAVGGSTAPLTLDTVNSRVGIGTRTVPDVPLALGVSYLGGALLTSGNQMIQIGLDTTTYGGFAVGQASNRNLQIYWRPNATSLNAVAVMETASYANPMYFNAAGIFLCAEASSATLYNVHVGTTTDVNAKLYVLKSNAATSGTEYGINATTTFSPTSGTAVYTHMAGTYTVNQTGGANGTVTGLLLTATETAVVGTHNMIRCLAGAAGTTVMFNIDNTGLASFGLAKIALGGGAAPTFGTIGGSGPTTAAQSGWIKEVRAGTTVFIPAWV